MKTYKGKKNKKGSDKLKDRKIKATKNPTKINTADPMLLKAISGDMQNEPIQYTAEQLARFAKVQEQGSAVAGLTYIDENIGHAYKPLQSHLDRQAKIDRMKGGNTSKKKALQKKLDRDIAIYKQQMGNKARVADYMMNPGSEIFDMGGAVGRGRDGLVRHYIESPDETIVESQIAMARAKQKAMNNGWAQGLDLLGNMAVQYGTSMMTSGGGGIGAGGQAGFGGNIVAGGGDGGAFGQGFGNWMGNNSNALATGISMLPMLAQMTGPGFAYGGTIPNVPVEVEGEEVGEMPNGDIIDFKGPSHEQGGIDINLPEGTEIFSKRIKVGGKTMAERKKSREKKLMTLEKLLEKSGGEDKVLRDSIKRTKKNNELEETKDQKLQEMISTMRKMASYAYGTGKKGVDRKMYNDGTGPFGVPLMYDAFGNPIFNPVAQTNTSFLHGDGSQGRRLSKQNPIDYAKIDNYFNNFSIGDDASRSGDGGKQNMKTPNFNSEDGFEEVRNPGGQRTYPSGTNTDAPPNKGGDNKGLGMKLTGGDAIGLAGTIYSAFKPMDNTLANRAGDTPNINAFKDYGNDALDRIEEAKGYISGQRDKALQDLETSRTRVTRNNRNTARGVNTLRALDLASDVNANRAESDIYDNFSKQMMQLISQQAGFENQQDQAVMSGEQARDLADRQDRDNFYSQMAQDIATKGQGIQQVGKMLNQNRRNTMAEQAVNDSSINFQYTNGTLTDKAGNVVMTQGEIEKAAKTMGVTVEEYINMINSNQ